MSRRKLSIADKEYIENHLTDFTPAEISANIECNLDVVEKYVEELEAKKSNIKKGKSKLDLAGRKSGAITMTQELSEVADETVQNSFGRYGKCIHKPLGED